MPDFSKPSVTVIGLGAMGSALASAVLTAGYPTAVWNRSPERTQPLVAAGAVAAATPAEAIEASRLVIVCLLDMASVTDVLDPAKDALAGRVLVNLTNGTPAQARELIAPLETLMARRVAAGHGHEDLAGVVELLKEGK
jgi:3-hydroxyisobutyrate dehydrogenase-like beta-hydroxyacid dehydrogenase